MWQYVTTVLSSGTPARANRSFSSFLSFNRPFSSASEANGMLLAPGILPARGIIPLSLPS